MRFLSLFSGIEAASVAWHPLGWRCVGVAEIDKFPCAVLAHHYPDVPNLGSVTDITDEQIAALGPIDVVVGGSPCQDLSIAGKRAGLAGERSGLFHEQLRIFHAARDLCGARFLLWENVPGAFCSNRGLDFAVVAGAMAGADLSVPTKGWGPEGVALGSNGLVEWCVLDAQWFGVAQRRRRVFALLDTGDWANRPPILLEPDRLRGDYPPCRKTPEVAPTIPSRRSGGGGLGTDFDCDGGLIYAPEIARCVATREGSSQDYETTTMVTHTLRGEGFDASEDGTGRDTPLVPVSGIKYAYYSHDYAHDKITDPAGVAPALTKEAHASGNLNVAVGFDFQNCAATGDLCGTLMGEAQAKAGQAGHGVLAFMADDYKDGGFEECDTARPLTTSADRTRAAPIVATPPGRMAVRRITPTEAERLQGFPDGYTAIPWRGKPAEKCPDGPRYKALGNSFAVPVVAWIGRQIARHNA